MEPTMLSFTYVHSHECAVKDKIVTTYPRISGNEFYEIPPRCIENGIELELVQRDKENIY